jgi:Flagellar hook-length control protein FliK
VAREGADPGQIAALAAQGGGQGAHAGSGSSAGAGDGGQRGNATPGWTPLTPANGNPHSAGLGDMPVGLSALGPRADIRAAAPAAPTAPPVPVNLALPITSPEFSRAMGAQLAALAKGGVERVELHLNPAEMGPVSVQIAIEGAQARIDFGADVAATRHAIEAGLPELASALRDAGLTLTGGGVSQQSSRSRDDMAEAQARGQARGQAGERGRSDAGEAPTPPRRMVRAGGVDMYA